MAIPAGSRIGTYEVTGSLGAGGMGEVYRARDTRLNRDVALKVLPETFAADPDRLARFEREAQLLATLNHPNIGAIYGIVDGGSAGAFPAPAPPQTSGVGRVPRGEAPGGPSGPAVQALILELVEGPTLADRIAEGPIPIDEALPIAKQIADALEAAHEKGIIHRDLKPANIKLMPDGKVKVLDFGLAKLNDPSVSNGPHDPGILSLSPTMTSPALMTGAGVILGTAAYMSPEQARGKPVDRRADIWAFGCLFFEMLAGRRPFDAGETVSDAVAAVLRGDPEWKALPMGLPPFLDRLLRACLEKDLGARVSHIAVARYALERGADPVAASAAQRPSSRARPVWLVAAALTGAVLAVLSTWLLIPDPPVPAVTRFEVPLAAGLQAANASTQMIAISRDGRQVAYGGRHLYRRLLSERETIPIPGTDATDGSVSMPVFSPDGGSIAFVTGTSGRASLMRIDLSGGPPVKLADVLLVLGMSWDATGILYAEARRGILRISPTGGEPEMLVAQNFGPEEQALQGPRLLPDGRTLLYAVIGSESRIVAQRLGTSERTVLARGTDARYLPTGHLVYAGRGPVYAVPFDPDTLAVGDRPAVVIPGVMNYGALSSFSAFYDVSDNGTLWYVPGGTVDGAGRSLMMVTRGGETQPLKLAPGAYEFPRVSPDGAFVAFERGDGAERDIWVYDLSGASSMRRLTFGGSNRFPVWSADGRRVTYQSTRDGASAIYWQLADGTGPAERLTTPAAGEAHVPESWSPGGDFLIFESRRQNLITMQLLSMRDRAVSRFGPAESLFPFGPTFSPDGRWVAYSNPQGESIVRMGPSSLVTNAVFVEPFPPTGAKYQVSRDDDGHHPVWMPGGGELVYTRGPGQVAAVAISSTPAFTFSEPMALSAGRMSMGPGTRRGHDPLPGGQRFVAMMPSSRDQVAEEVASEVVLNWFEELKRLVPVD